MINFYFKLVEIAVSVRQSDVPIKNHKSFRDSSMIYFFTSSWFLPSWNCVFLNRWIYFILKSPADNSAISICQSRWLITGYSAGCLTRRWASSHSFTLKSDSNSSMIGFNSQKIAHGLKKNSRIHVQSSELRSAKDPENLCPEKNLYRLKFLGQIHIRFSWFYLGRSSGNQILGIPIQRNSWGKYKFALFIRSASKMYPKTQFWIFLPAHFSKNCCMKFNIEEWIIISKTENFDLSSKSAFVFGSVFDA